MNGVQFHPQSSLLAVSVGERHFAVGDEEIDDEDDEGYGGVDGHGGQAAGLHKEKSNIQLWAAPQIWTLT